MKEQRKLTDIIFGIVIIIATTIFLKVACDWEFSWYNLFDGPW